MHEDANAIATAVRSHAASSSKPPSSSSKGALPSEGAGSSAAPSATRAPRPRHRLPPSPATMAQTTAPFSRSVIAPSTYGAPQRTCSRTFGLKSSDRPVEGAQQQPATAGDTLYTLNFTSTYKKIKINKILTQRSKAPKLLITKIPIKIKVVSLSLVSSMSL